MIITDSSRFIRFLCISLAASALLFIQNLFSCRGYLVSSGSECTAASITIFLLHTMQLSCILFIASFLSAFLLHRFTRTIPALIAHIMPLSAIIVLSAADYALYRTIDLHLDSPTVIASFTNRGFFRETNPGGTAVAAAALYVSLITGLLVFIFIRSKYFRFRRMRLMRSVLIASGLTLTTIIAATVAEHAAAGKGDSVIDALPWYNMLHPGSHKYSSAKIKLHYPDILAVTNPPRINSGASMLFIAVETWRADAVNGQTMPLLYKRIQKKQALYSERHLSGSHATEYGVFSLLYGLHASRYIPFMNSSVISAPLGILQRNGYSLNGYASANISDWGGSAFIFQRFSSFYEETSSPTWLADQKLIDRLIPETKTRLRFARPSFTFVMLNSTHHNYYYPPGQDHFTPAAPENYNHYMPDDSYTEERELIRNRYKNSARFMDTLLDRILSTLMAEVDAGRLIIVITGDHGEEFWERGALGHASEKLNSWKTEVPFLVFARGLSGRTQLPTQHADIFPTVFQLLKTDRPAPLSDYCDGSAITGGITNDRIGVICNTAFPLRGRGIMIVDSGNTYHFSKKPSSPDRLQLTAITDRNDNPITIITADHEKKAVILRDSFIKQQKRFQTFD